jgi:hypothetical protein
MGGEMRWRARAAHTAVVTREGEGFAEVEQIDGDISADGIGPLGGVGKP